MGKVCLLERALVVLQWVWLCIRDKPSIAHLVQGPMIIVSESWGREAVQARWHYI